MNEGSQTNLATCDLFPVGDDVLHSSCSSIVAATFEHQNLCPTLFKTNRFRFLLPEKENKKLKIEQLPTYKCT